MKETNSPVIVISDETLQAYLDSKEVKLEIGCVNTVDSLCLKVDGFDPIPLLHLVKALEIPAKNLSPVFGSKTGKDAEGYDDLDHFTIEKPPVDNLAKVINKRIVTWEKLEHLDKPPAYIFSSHPKEDDC